MHLCRSLKPDSSVATRADWERRCRMRFVEKFLPTSDFVSTTPYTELTTYWPVRPSHPLGLYRTVSVIQSSGPLALVHGGCTNLIWSDRKKKKKGLALTERRWWLPSRKSLCSRRESIVGWNAWSRIRPEPAVTDCSNPLPVLSANARGLGRRHGPLAFVYCSLIVCVFE